MDILIKSATIVHKGHPLHLKKADILINNGIIKSIAENIDVKNVTVFSSENLHVSIGWMDMRANFSDPGLEHREDIKSGLQAAAKGGYTAVAIMPSTNPPLHSKSQIEYALKNASGNICNIYPMGCISQNREGKDMAEMFDMKKAGAIAFTDDKRPVENAGLLLRALQYNKIFNGLVVSFAEDKNIAGDGKVNEGVVATRLGLKGIPALAEELMIARDIYLAEYADAPIHFTCISAAKSVELIKAARKKGVKVTADVTAHHLLLNDSVLEGFDSNYKVKPPLRTIEDCKALIAGINDGTIAVICSDHTPQEIEMKDREFDHAGYGIIALQTAFACANEALKNKVKLEDIIAAISINPRKVLGITQPQLQEGAKAELTLFNPDLSWELKAEDIVSKSKNTPFIGRNMLGKALAIANNGQWLEV
jgi:dihydroorotase